MIQNQVSRLALLPDSGTTRWWSSSSPTIRTSTWKSRSDPMDTGSACCSTDKESASIMVGLSNNFKKMSTTIPLYEFPLGFRKFFLMETWWNVGFLNRLLENYSNPLKFEKFQEKTSNWKLRTSSSTTSGIASSRFRWPIFQQVRF